MIKIKHGDREADAKSILGVLSLGAGRGSEIEVTVQGPDEEEAFLEILALLSTDSEQR